MSNLSSNKYLKLATTSLKYLPYYLKTKRFLKKTEYNSKEEIEAKQLRLLKRIIEHSYKNVPYYHDLFNRENISPDDIKKLEDIKKIPYLTKDIIRENIDRIISPTVPKKYIKNVLSGGTSGLPLEFYLDKRTSSPIEMAYIQHLWKRIGFKLYDRCIVLRGEALSVKEDKKYWKMNRSINWLSMSSFHINDQTFSIYLDKINSFKPKFIIAYPSVIYLLAVLFKRYDIPPIKSLKAIILSSESVYESQRKYIENVFNTRAFSYYGLSEKCCIAAECENSTFYEFAPYYGFVEYINQDEEWCTKEDEKGEIVATSFNNYAFPFIRYKTGDTCIFTNKKQTERNWPVIKQIIGRAQEFLVDRTNSVVTFTCHDEPFYTIIKKINAYQFHQDKPGEIKVLIENIEPLDETELSKVKEELNDYYKDIAFTFETEKSIARTKSGKLKYLIQNLDLDEINI
ncbi:MAG: phenylacetate--CoA ligase family protein [Bacteroidales bacterium]|nr:MAG: phenylacetate--CoA ligase family protein [Bacteroidales bacterium]